MTAPADALAGQIARLVARQEVADCLVRFARAMDYRDWAAFDTLVAEGAVADMGSGPLRGRAEIVGIMRRYLDACGPTQHLLGNVLIDVAGDTATSHAYVYDQHLPPGGATAPTFHTLGDYHDRWQRRDGRWWLVERIKDNRANVGSMAVFGMTEG